MDTSTQIIQDKGFKQRLERLAETSSHAVAIFSSRCVLRMLPFLAEEGHFAYWENAKRPYYLLALWRVALLVYANNEKIPLQLISDTSDALIRAPSASENAKRVMRSLAGLTDIHSAVNNYSTAYSALTITYNSSAANLIEAIADVDLLEKDSSNHLLNRLLWENARSEKVEYDRLADSIHRLIEATDDKKTKHCLSGIMPLYQQIYQGKAEQSDIEETLENLRQYFALYSSAEGVQNVSPPSIHHSENQTQLAFNYLPPKWQNDHRPSEVDSLNRQQLVNALAGVLADKSNIHHQTIGLLGDWGVGKSTIVKLLKKQLLEEHQEQPFLFAEFNAWEYEHTENLQAGIAQEMVTALSSPDPTVESIGSDVYSFSLWQQCCWSWHRAMLTLDFATAIHGRWPRIKLAIVVLIEFILAWFLVEIHGNSEKFLPGLGAGAAGVGLLIYFFRELRRWSANPLAKEFLTYLKLPDYAKHLGTIPVMRKNIKAMCQVRLQKNTQRHKRLLYIVDDLDRCDPKNIVKVFNAVRLVLDIPQVIVVVAIDQRIALSALALHYKELEEYHPSNNSISIARDYLSKIIHLPITIGKPNRESVSFYLNRLWDRSYQKPSPQKTLPLSHSDVDQKNTHLFAQEKTASKEIKQDVGAVDSQTTMSVTTAASTASTPVRLGLSQEQKIAFEYWVNYFGLANPRQLKRLHNSYNLLRNYYSVDYRPMDIDTQGKSEVFQHVDALVFPVMMTLFALEYVNHLESLDQRVALRAYLAGDYQQEQGDAIIIADIARITQQGLEGKPIKLVDAIEPFVLPAMD